MQWEEQGERDWGGKAGRGQGGQEGRGYKVDSATFSITSSGYWYVNSWIRM